MSTQIKMPATFNKVQVIKDDFPKNRILLRLSRQKSKGRIERKSTNNIVPANYHFMRPQKRRIDSKTSVATQSTVCTDNDDESIGNISDISVFSNNSNECALISVLDSMELEKEDSILMNEKSSRSLHYLISEEKKYEEFRRFLTVFGTNF